MLDKLADASHNDSQIQGIEPDQKLEELRIIPLSDASAQPYTMVIETFDAIVAQITVSRVRRTENETALAEFQSRER